MNFGELLVRTRPVYFRIEKFGCKRFSKEAEVAAWENQAENSDNNGVCFSGFVFK